LARTGRPASDAQQKITLMLFFRFPHTPHIAWLG
jgi:hypothetical protein